MRSPRVHGKGHLVRQVVDNQVEIDRFLPVNVGVPNRQLPTVPSKYLEKEMVFTVNTSGNNLPRGFRVFLPWEGNLLFVITVNGKGV